MIRRHNILCPGSDAGSHPAGHARTSARYAPTVCKVCNSTRSRWPVGSSRWPVGGAPTVCKVCKSTRRSHASTVCKVCNSDPPESCPHGVQGVQFRPAGVMLPRCATCAIRRTGFTSPTVCKVCNSDPPESCLHGVQGVQFRPAGVMLPRCARCAIPARRSHAPTVCKVCNSGPPESCSHSVQGVQFRPARGGQWAVAGGRWAALLRCAKCAIPGRRSHASTVVSCRPLVTGHWPPSTCNSARPAFGALTARSKSLT